MSLEDKKALYRRIRQEQPEMAEFIDTVATVFAGAKVTYVRLDETEWGEQ